ncbi:hypothetical protein PSSHI_47580 [Photobacterium sp. R1]
MVKKNFYARKKGNIYHLCFPESTGFFDGKLFLNAGKGSAIKFQGKLIFADGCLSSIKIIDLTGNGDNSGNSNKGYGSDIVSSTLAFLQYYFTNADLITSTVKLIGKMSPDGDDEKNACRSHQRRVAFWQKMGMKVHDPSSQYSRISGLFKRESAYIIPSVQVTDWYEDIDVRAMSHCTDEDKYVALCFWRTSLAQNKQELSRLENLHSEHNENERSRLKQWVRIYQFIGAVGAVGGALSLGMPAIDVVISMLIGAVAGLLMFHHNGPNVKEYDQLRALISLRCMLKDEITERETLQCGLLYRLLTDKNLLSTAQRNGLTIPPGQIKSFHLAGEGMSQYLDAFALVMNDVK